MRAATYMALNDGDSKNVTVRRGAARLPQLAVVAAAFAAAAAAAARHLPRFLHAAALGASRFSASTKYLASGWM